MDRTCGNCMWFFEDFNNPGMGACGNLNDSNIANGTYDWTTIDGGCGGWRGRTDAWYADLEHLLAERNPNQIRMEDL